jgi:uncharacterized protein (DUF433 family)
MFARITFDSSIMGGHACIRRMRIPVSVIVGQIAHRAPIEEILEGGYHDLERKLDGLTSWIVNYAVV